MILFKPDGTYLISTGTNNLTVQDDSRRNNTLMGDDTLTLTVLHSEYISIPLRSYCFTDDGTRYTLYNYPEVEKVSNSNYKYTLHLFSPVYELSLVLMRDSIEHRLKWQLTDTPRAQLQQICNNLNEAGSHYLWRVDYSNCLGMESDSNGAYAAYHTPAETAPSDLPRYSDKGDEKLMDYDFSTCLDALQNIADQFETEYSVRFITYNNTDYALLSLNPVEVNKNTPLTLSYGKGGGILSGMARSNRQTSPKPNVVFIQGGDRNIPEHYGQSVDTTTTPPTYGGVASKTLLLPKSRLCVYYAGAFYFSNDEIPSSRITTSGYTTVVTARNNGNGSTIGGGSGNTSGASQGAGTGSGSTLYYEVMLNEDGMVAGEVDPQTGDATVDPFPHNSAALAGLHMPCYLTSADGHSLQRVRHSAFDSTYTAQPPVQGYNDCTDIYPSRLGTVAGVAVVNEASTAYYGTTGNGTNATPSLAELTGVTEVTAITISSATTGISTATVPTDETKKFYDIYDSDLASENWSYTDHNVPGETMSVVFQDGMLAGREFNIQGYDAGTNSGKPICARGTIGGVAAMRIPLCQAEIDGVIMPAAEFVPKAGDHYIVFHCSLPDAYVSGIPYGAEFRALRKMVAELAHSEHQGYNVDFQIDPIWLRAHWTTAEPKLVVGGHVLVLDEQLLPSATTTNLFRITAVETSPNDQYYCKLTVGDTLLPKFRWQKQIARTVRTYTRQRLHLRYGPYVPHIDNSTDAVGDSSIVDYQGSDRPQTRYVHGESLPNS